MRVISGKAGGLRLKTLKGLQTRPTADKIKGSLFNIISPLLENAVVLDLFAGSGALGIESLSRGAKCAVLADSSRESIAIIKENLRHTKMEEWAQVYQNDFANALKILAQRSMQFDIVFLDPPYSKGMEVNAAQLIMEYELLADAGVVIIETETTLSDNLFGMIKYDTRNYGRTTLSFFKKEQ